MERDLVEFSRFANNFDEYTCNKFLGRPENTPWDVSEGDRIMLSI